MMNFTVVQPSSKHHAPRAPLLTRFIFQERWFHGSISSVQAEKLLQDSKADGSFLVRRSASKMGSYVISALVKQDVFHIMVHCTENKYHLQGGCCLGVVIVVVVSNLHRFSVKICNLLDSLVITIRGRLAHVARIHLYCVLSLLVQFELNR